MFRNLSANLLKKVRSPAFANKSMTTATSCELNYNRSSLMSKLLAEGNGGKRIVGYWLAGTSAAVFGIIVFGGLTRLTESGLSMVDWKLIHFSAPKSEQEWQDYFDKYKEFPEYKM